MTAVSSTFVRRNKHGRRAQQLYCQTK